MLAFIKYIILDHNVFTAYSATAKGEYATLHGWDLLIAVFTRLMPLSVQLVYRVFIAYQYIHMQLHFYLKWRFPGLKLWVELYLLYFCFAS